MLRVFAAAASGESQVVVGVVWSADDDRGDVSGPQESSQWFCLAGHAHRAALLEQWSAEQFDRVLLVLVLAYILLLVLGLYYRANYRAGYWLSCWVLMQREQAGPVSFGDRPSDAAQVGSHAGARPWGTAHRGCVVAEKRG